MIAKALLTTLYLSNVKVVFMGKNRDRLSIVGAILEAASPGASKTKIMFSANLSFKLLEKYLDLVIGSGLVLLEGTMYQLTPEGRAFLKRFRDFSNKLTQMQESLEILDEEHQRLDTFFGKSGRVSEIIEGV